jgi:GDP-mannose 6-dehydrogenase
MKIAVFGLGYVGTVTAAGLASRGHDVCGVDVDAAKVSAVQAGRSPVVEPGVGDLIRDAVSSGRLRATTDASVALDRADVSLLCVGTPSSPNGGTDLSHLIRAVDDIRAALSVAIPPQGGRHAVIVRSTVPPGTGDEVVAPALTADRVPPGWAVGTGMCPEFLREGVGVSDFFEPPFVVLGTDDEQVRRAVTGMFTFLDREIHHVDVRTAEALKYACNAFHATKVSFANEMARIFRACGVDARRVMEIFCEDRILNVSPAYLRPGFAFGGSCLPKDLRSLLYMARAHSLDVPLLAGTVRTNELLVNEVVERVIAGPSRAVAMLGLSFKMDTDDLRESPNVEVAERLIGKGVDVRIYDPIINPELLIGTNLRYIEARLPHLRRLLAATPQEALAGTDTAVVVTSDASVLARLCDNPPPRILDLHGRLGPDVERLPGYEGVGWVV